MGVDCGRGPCVVIVGMSLLLLFGCGGGNGQTSGGDFRFQLSVLETAFMPSTLTVENDARVTVVLRNRGTRAHDFVVSMIPDAKIAAIDPTQTATVTFKSPNQEKVYPFSCDLPGHNEVGSLVVK